MSGDQEAGAGEAGGGGAVVSVRHRAHRFPGRGRRITVRLGEEELAAIVAAAGQAGLTPTGYVGAGVLAAARGVGPPAPSQTWQVLVELVQLRRFGANVNQAVAALQATGQPPGGWLAAAVELAGRAVARVDAAAEQLLRQRR